MRLYLIAMLDEANDIINEYDLVLDNPFLLYKKDNNLLAITGIGKVNSAFVASYLLAKYPVKEIINTGFVGAFGNYKVGEIIIVDKAKYHDVDVTMFGYEKGQVPKMPVFYQPNKELLKKVPKYKESLLLTGDCFMTDQIGDDFIVDMEATAIFQVAYRLNIPMISIKIVSDIINSKDHLDKYKDFAELGSKNIFELYLELEDALND